MLECDDNIGVRVLVFDGHAVSKIIRTLWPTQQHRFPTLIPQNPQFATVAIHTQIKVPEECES